MFSLEPQKINVRLPLNLRQRIDVSGADPQGLCVLLNHKRLCLWFKLATALVKLIWVALAHLYSLGPILVGASEWLILWLERYAVQKKVCLVIA